MRKYDKCPILCWFICNPLDGRYWFLRNPRFAVLTALWLRIQVFWDVMLCRWKSVFRRFEVSLHLTTAEDERAFILQIVENSQPITACQIPEAFNPIPPKPWYLFTQIIGVTSQMTVILILIFTDVRTSVAWEFYVT